MGQRLQQLGILSRRLFDRFEQPVAQRSDFRQVALVLWINQPEAVFV